jgi:hypothetical protein
LGIGNHELPNKGESVIWLTPPCIIQSLGVFDLDPCAAPSPRPWPTAQRHFELPEDGLSLPWKGRVWLNPPYDENIGKWMEKMALHGSGIALIFARTEIEVWQRWVWPYADKILFIAGRLSFYFPDGTKGKGSSGAPSTLISYSKKDSEILYNSGIAGAFVDIIRPRVGQSSTSVQQSW